MENLCTDMSKQEKDWLMKRRVEVSNMPVSDKLEIITDTTQFMSIQRGQIIKLGDKYFLVTGAIYESRFGLDDEPKYWVKKVVDLDNGEKHIIKMVYYEEFYVKIGPLRIRCYRNPGKEGRVLRLVHGHPDFMHGYSLYDQCDNEVRIIKFIQGKSLYNRILELSLSHEEYFFTIFPPILKKLCECFSAIHYLHENGLCHGDIRNDHILVEEGTENFRWIDFDLTQDFSDFDIWSLGNILQFCVGKGMRTFQEALQSPDFDATIKNQLTSDDASAFYKHRIINLKKLFPYIPKRLNDVLLHFAVNAQTFYESAPQIVCDLKEAIQEMPNSTMS